FLAGTPLRAGQPRFNPAPASQLRAIPPLQQALPARERRLNALRGYIRTQGETMPASRIVKLSEAKIALALSKLPDWKLKGGKLHREYKFADFIAPFGLMNGAALVAAA